MRRVLASGAGFAALALGTGLLSSCPGLHHRDKSDKGAMAGMCPMPIVAAKGHFYRVEEGNRAVFDAIGSFADAFDEDGTVRLDSVTLFGLAGHHSADELTGDDTYSQTFLATIVPPTPYYWSAPGFETTTAYNAWDGGPSYTLVVRHHYMHKTAHGGWRGCFRDRAVHFESIAPTPFVDGVVDESIGGTQSHTAAVTVSGGFFGTMSYALYDGHVDYDPQSDDAPAAIECYSSPQRANLFDSGSMFHSEPGSSLAAHSWPFSSLVDPTYSGSDTWYVGFRVIYNDGAALKPYKKFTGLLSKQGTIIIGQ